MLIKLLFVAWVIVGLLFASWIAQYFYDEYKDRKK